MLYGVVMKIKNIVRFFRNEFIKKKAYYEITSKNFRKTHPEFTKEIEFIKKRKKLELFPYSFINKYGKDNYPMYKEDGSEIPYFIYKGKKLFFSDENIGVDSDFVKWKYSCLMSEQDDESPHKYFTNNFYVEKNDLFIDVGCAEGKEALEILDDASKVYLFECDTNWNESLKRTFDADIKSGKVIIINKYVSDSEKDGCVKLDDVVESDKNLFIKMDVEGAEYEVIKSAEKLIKNAKSVKLVATCYHNKDDADKIVGLLEEMGFTWEFSDGYMLYFYGDTSNFIYPYFRHGVIRAQKSIQ